MVTYRVACKPLEMFFPQLETRKTVTLSLLWLLTMLLIWCIVGKLKKEMTRHCPQLHEPESLDPTLLRRSVCWSLVTYYFISASTSCSHVKVENTSPLSLIIFEKHATEVRDLIEEWRCDETRKSKRKIFTKREVTKQWFSNAYRTRFTDRAWGIYTI